MIDDSAILKPNRVGFIDFTKGVAIFLVLYGHVIQFCTYDDYDFWTSPIFKFIYSFHMPLFMAVSGFFFKSSTKYSLKEFIKVKFGRLILPVLSWRIIFILFVAVVTALKIGLGHETLVKCADIAQTTFTSFWFISSLVVCYLISFISLKYLKSYILYALVVAVTYLFLPDFYYFKTMLPLFVLGMVMKHNIDKIDRYYKPILLISLLVSVTLYQFFTLNRSIYLSDFQIFDSYTLNYNPIGVVDFIIRLTLGASITVFIITLLKRTYKDNRITKIIAEVGRYTLGIYIIQQYFMLYLNSAINFNGDSSIFLFVIAPLISALIIALIVAMQIKISKYKTISRYLFGW